MSGEPTRDGDPVRLLEGVDSETRELGDFEGEIDRVLLCELRLLGAAGEQRPERVLGVVGAQRLHALVARDLAVNAVQRRRADLEVQIGALFLHELTQRTDDIEHTHVIGTRLVGLECGQGPWTN